MAFNPNDYIIDTAMSMAVSSAVNGMTSTHTLLDGISVTNLTAAVAYLQVFSVLSTDVTLGTTIPDWQVAIPANGNVTMFFPKPIRFASQVCFASTTTAGGATPANTYLTMWHGLAAF